MQQNTEYESLHEKLSHVCSYADKLYKFFSEPCRRKPFMPDRVSSDYPLFIEQAMQEWINKLIESSSPRQFLHYRDLPAGTLDLSDYDPQTLSKLLANQPVSLTQLAPTLETFDTERRLDTICQTAREKQDQQGLNTLFLALGIASWTTTADKGTPAAPVLLVPVTINCDHQLQQNGEAQINPFLLQVLETKLRCAVEADTLLSALEAAEGSDLEALFECLADAARQVNGFAIERRAVLGNFWFKKMAMVADLKDRRHDMVSHPVIVSLASGSKLSQSCSSHSSQEDASLENYLVLKADSSQKEVIHAVFTDPPVTVIQGPAGNGKSLTIGNLIAALAAKGQRILFVVKKRAALEALQRSLERVGLGHLLLDLYEHGDRHQVIQQFADSWDIIQQTPHRQTRPVQQQVVKKVQALRQLAERTHKPQPLTGKSIYDMRGELLHFAPEEQVSACFSSETLQALNRTTVAAIEADLREVGGDALLCGLFLQTASSFWLQEASLPSQAIAQRVGETVERLLNEQWPVFRDALTALLKPTGLKGPETLHQTNDYLTLFESVNTTLSLYTSDLFQLDLAACVQCLEPLQKGYLCKTIASLGNATFKATLSTLHSFRRAGKVSDELLLEEVTHAAEQQRQWRALSSLQAVPCQTVSQSAVVRAQLHAFMAQLASVRSYLKHQALHTVRFEELRDYLQRLAAEPMVPAKLARVQAIEHTIDSLGAGALVADLREALSDPALWVRQFQYACLRSHLEVALDEQPLPGIVEQGTVLEADIQTLQQLSPQQRQAAIDRLCEAHAQRVITTMDEKPDQEARLKEEIKKECHKALSPFLNDTFDVLTSLRPCWMMDPLSVSQLLDQPCQFDVVIFDEASQLAVEESVPAIRRGKRVVVAGDQEQLSPPGRYHSKSLLDSLDDDIVDAHWLRSHYRSVDDRLIAYANQYVYENRLLTFPSAFNQSPLHHLVVKPSSQKSELENQKDFEAAVLQRLWWLREEVLLPDGILVITTSQDQAKRWQSLIDAEFNSQSGYSVNNFIVKHLQSVQGAEAKAVCLLLDYGRTRSGALNHQLGSLVEAGGERGFLTSTSRAQELMCVISSFDPHELDPEKCKHPNGISHLKGYSEYSKREAPGRTAQEASEADLDCFESYVFHALTARGLKLMPLIGKSQAKIRLAAVHPKRPDRLVLALDTDGPHHQGLLDIQDQYLLWPEQLEKRGFRVHRLWSADWFSDREAAITRVEEAFWQAVADADRTDGPFTTSTNGAATEPSRKLDNGLPRQRGACPSFIKCHPPQNLGNDLTELLRWIETDGLRRTEQDLLEAMKATLEKRQYWKQIGKRDDLLRAAIEQYRSSSRHTDEAEGPKRMLIGSCKIDRPAKQQAGKQARVKRNKKSHKTAPLWREDMFLGRR